jgi:YfiH family protein
MMGFQEQNFNGVIFRTAEALSSAGGVIHGFSTRMGGVSTGIWASMNLGTTRGDDPENVRENYWRFCVAVGADCSSIVMSNQVHGNNIRVVTRADVKRDLYDPEGYDTDGLVTDIPGVVLTIFSADCIPILFYDPVRKVIAAAHAGWAGTAKGIASRAVEKMADTYGCNPADILAAVGPGISKCCFETHADVPNAMTGALGACALPYIAMCSGGTYKVDLKGLNSLQLQKAGVTAEHISVDPDCTLCNPDKYWSYRVHGDSRGSMAAVIQMTV